MNVSSRSISPSSESISAADAMLKLSGIALMKNSDANLLCSNGVQSANHSDMNSSLNDEFIKFLSVNKQCDINQGLSNYRKEREFIPEDLKDEHYWSKRKKNNESAKCSRAKRRINDVVLNKKISELQEDNNRLRIELEAIKNHFKLPTHISFNNPNLTPYLTYSVAPLITTDKSTESDSSSSVDGIVNGNIKTEKDDISDYTCSLNTYNDTTPFQPKVISPITSDISTDCLLPIPIESNYNPWVMGDDKDNSFSSLDIKQEPMEEIDNALAENSNSQTTIDNEDQALDLKKFPLCHPKQVSSAESISNSPNSLTIAFPAVTSADESEEDNTDKSSFDLNENSEMICLSKTSSFLHNANNNSDKTERTRERKGIPQRLPLEEVTTEESETCENDQYSKIEENKVANMSENEQASFSGSEISNNHDKYNDLDFLAYRHRNNYSARKCRERRKTMVQITINESLNLEKENNNLRVEVEHLTSEKVLLQSLLVKKKEAELAGKSFTPPLIDKLKIPTVKIEIDG